MDEGSPHDWREVAASNRARITTLERELSRMRDRQHELAEDVAVIRYLAEVVKDLGEDVKKLTEQMSTVARRALEKPTPSGWAAAGSWAAVIVSVIALILVATHG